MDEDQRATHVDSNDFLTLSVRGPSLDFTIWRDPRTEINKNIIMAVDP